VLLLPTKAACSRKGLLCPSPTPLKVEPTLVLLPFHLSFTTDIVMVKVYFESLLSIILKKQCLELEVVYFSEVTIFKQGFTQTNQPDFYNYLQ